MEAEQLRLREVKGPTGTHLAASVAGREVRFMVARNRPSLAWDLVQNFRANATFARGAAIGLYWFGADKPEACRRTYTNALEWGSVVIDELFALGWRPSDITEIGDELFAHALATLPRFDAVEEEARPLE